MTYELTTCREQSMTIEKAMAVLTLARMGRFADASAAVMTPFDTRGEYGFPGGDQIENQAEARELLSASGKHLRENHACVAPEVVLPRHVEDGAVVYRLSLDAASHLQSGLDLLMRIHLGQLDEMLQVVPDWYKADSNVINRVRSSLERAQILMTGLQGGAYWSIGALQLDREAKVAYEILQAVRHRIAWDTNPNPTFKGVNYDRPMTFTKMPLPTMRQVGPVPVAGNEAGANTSGGPSF